MKGTLKRSFRGIKKVGAGWAAIFAVRSTQRPRTALNEVING